MIARKLVFGAKKKIPLRYKNLIKSNQAVKEFCLINNPEALFRTVSRRVRCCALVCQLELFLIRQYLLAIVFIEQQYIITSKIKRRTIMSN